MTSIFPSVTRAYVLCFQFSEWYPIFAKNSITSEVIRPLPDEFREYLDADGVFLPGGAEGGPKSELSDDEDSSTDEDSSEEQTQRKRYAFPDIDNRIRECVKKWDCVFPKLNFSSPQDASWLLPSSSPLKCTSPSDVYMLLKSSDFVNHDLDEGYIFEGCIDAVASVEAKNATADQTIPKYELELVLRKWYHFDKGREVRCFVRGGILLGISQRDTNYYEFWNHADTQRTVINSVRRFWEDVIKPRWTGTSDYIFDFLLTRDLSRGHIIDFNPYMPKTDALLFTYEELHELFVRSQLSASSEASPVDDLPQLKAIDSPAHPVASKNAPVNQHNMMPFEAFSMSSGKTVDEFADLWNESLKEGVVKPTEI